jgi:hypothetical protein
MVQKLKEIQRTRGDNNLNIQLGMRPIQAKIIAEQRGLIKPGTIASFGGVEDKELVEGKLRELEQEGFGLPGDMLKMKLLRSMKKSKKKSNPSARRRVAAGSNPSGCGRAAAGSGLNIPGSGADTSKIAKALAGCVSSKMLPMLLTKLGISGGGINKKKLNSLLHMQMLKAMNNGASRKTTIGSKNAVMVGRGEKLEMLKKGSAAIGKTLLPILLKAALKKMGGGGMEEISFAELQRRQANPSMIAKLSRRLSKGAFNFLKNYISKKMKGQGKSNPSARLVEINMMGDGFWSGFKKGFMSVINPVMKVAKFVAPIAPLLL